MLFHFQGYSSPSRINHSSLTARPFADGTDRLSPNVVRNTNQQRVKHEEREGVVLLRHILTCYANRYTVIQNFFYGSISA